MTATVVERVARGAALLDAKDPGWWRRDADPAIDLDDLAMHDGDRCILGQRCPRELRDPESGNYTRFAHELAADPSRLDEWGEYHGFDADSDFDDYSELAAEWIRVISERRSAA